MNLLKNNTDLLRGLSLRVKPGMTTKTLLFIDLLFAPLFAHAQVMPGVLSAGKWSHEAVTENIILHQGAFEGNLFDANQYLSVLEIAPGVRFDIVPSAEGTLETTSSLAERYGATAAVNGSFFNMKAPYGSVCYLRVDGEELASNQGGGERRPGEHWQGAVATFRGELYVLMSDGRPLWEKDIQAEDVLTAGPSLLAAGKAVDTRKVKFNTNRHPRTAVGRRPDGTVVLVVADGRNSSAAGLSIPELQLVMQALGCTEALNLDGGGSSAMVVRGKVVNHPSDNGKFDAEGERSVANAIIVY